MCSYALGGEPYAILFFIGEFPTVDISTRTTAPTRHPHFVGSVYNFSSPLVDADGNRVCENCDQQAAIGTLSTAQIPLTRTLYYHAADANINELDQMNPEAVEAYLEKHLNWVVASVSALTSLRTPRSNTFARLVEKSLGPNFFQIQRSLRLRESHSIFTRWTSPRTIQDTRQCHVLQRINAVALRSMNMASKSARSKSGLSFRSSHGCSHSLRISHT